MKRLTIDDLLLQPISETVRQQLLRLKTGVAAEVCVPSEIARVKLPVESESLKKEGRFVCHIAPLGKPRMTRRDKWKKRPCVMRYREFADKLRTYFVGIDLTDVHALSWIAYFPLPVSWSKKRKAAMRGQRHYSKPDRDNVDKAILDALFDQDSGVSHGTLTKLWDDGNGPRIEINIK